MDEDTRKSAKEKVRLAGSWEGSHTEGSNLRGGGGRRRDWLYPVSPPRMLQAVQRDGGRAVNTWLGLMTGWKQTVLSATEGYPWWPSG